MDMSLLSALVGAQTGIMQLAVATKLMRMDANQGQSIAKLIDAAQQSMAPIANVAAGIGINLDFSA